MNLEKKINRLSFIKNFISTISITMLQLTVLVILFFSLTDTTIGYTCSCYCPNSYNYIGTADSSSCDSYSCRLACYNTQSPCSLWYNTYGSVCSNETNFYTPIYSSRTCLGRSFIYCVASSVHHYLYCDWRSNRVAIFLISIIVTVIILCKRKRSEVWTVQV
jgi:hypothetical protein